MVLLRKHKWRLVIYGAMAGLILRLTLFHPFKVSDNAMAPAVVSGDRLLSLRIFPSKDSGSVKRGRIYIFRHPMISQGLTLKRLIALSGDKLHLSADSITVNNAKLSIRQSALRNPAADVLVDPRTAHASLTIPRASDTLDFSRAGYREFDFWVNLIRQENPGVTYHVQGELFVDGSRADADFLTKVLKMKEPPMLNTMPWYDIVNFVEQISGLFPKQQFSVHRTLLQQGNTISRYLLKNDCFFTLGDNRDQSFDSRYWGFVPKSSLYSRPFLIYWSNVPGKWIKINFSRLLKFIK